MGKSRFVALHDGTVAWTYGQLEHLPKYTLEIEELRQLGSGPAAEERSAAKHHRWRKTCGARTARCMESQGVKPTSVTGTPEFVFFTGGEKPPQYGVFASPFLNRIRCYPFIGNTADFDNLLQQGERLRRQGTWNMWSLCRVVGYETDCIIKRSVLGFCGVV